MLTTGPIIVWWMKVDAAAVEQGGEFKYRDLRRTLGSSQIECTTCYAYISRCKRNKVVQPKTPRKLTNKIKKLIQMCVGPDQKPIRLPYTRERAFKAEVSNCHINNMVKCKHDEGEIVFGWVIWEDRNFAFVEAEFHSVWRSPEGKLVDITPRKNQEKEVLFIRDTVRIVEMISHEKQAALQTHDNVRILSGTQLPRVSSVIGIIDSNLAIEEGLVVSRKTDK